ncbi:MAG: HAD-IB family hydrolase [Thermoplasmatales archaeon]|nr:HAD-IB family hydrolase [Thermoplasmatales archaeon]
MTDANDGIMTTAAFFDLDLTITSRDSFRYFLIVQYLRTFSNWHLIPVVLINGIGRKLRIISLRTFKENALICFKGQSYHRIKETGRLFFVSYLKGIIKKKAVERINWHKKQGHLTFIVTSSPDIYVSHLTHHLKLDGYECSRLLFKNNYFVCKFESNDCLGKEKNNRLKLLADKFAIDLKNSYAYSDHESDIPFLASVGNPVIISPTLNLQKKANENGWKIEYW